MKNKTIHTSLHIQLFTLRILTLALVTLCLCTLNLNAQAPTVGLLQYDSQGHQDGYVLFAPLYSNTTYLIDKCGKQVHTWESTTKPGLSAYLLNDGSLLRPGSVNNPTFILGGGSGGLIEKISWDGTILWSYQISDTMICQHHDIKPMPNGNVLAIVWKSKTYKETVDLGRDTAKTNDICWFESIVEIAPTGLNTGEIVWEWNSYDHLVQSYDSTKSNFGVISDKPERININYGLNFKIADWLHVNSVDYNPELDQILVSAYKFDEVWIIDHSTTTKQAATNSGGKYGKGGDLLYRWGNPESYNRGTPADRKLFGQHSARWIERGLVDSGKILVFNNGSRGSATYSSVDIINPPIDQNGMYPLEKGKPFAPVEQDWIYTDSVRGDFFSPNYSAAQRLPNGNTLICSGFNGLIFEITPDNKKVWGYKNPVSISGIAKQGDNVSANSVYRAEFYPSDFSGFSERMLESGNPIELNPGISICEPNSIDVSPNDIADYKIYPNPANQILSINLGSNAKNINQIVLVNALGVKVGSSEIQTDNNFYTIDLQNIPSGVYALKVISDFSDFTEKVLIIK